MNALKYFKIFFQRDEKSYFNFDTNSLIVYNTHVKFLKLEGWPSGRRRTTRNRFDGDEPSRGFKSHPLRQKYTYSNTCGELSERPMVNGWKPFAVMSRQRFESSTLRHFIAF